MKLWEILVPASTPGNVYKLSHHKAWGKKVREIAGGLTIMKPAQGEWISPVGKLHRDRVIPVRIMCDLESITTIAAFTTEHYEQEAVMYYAVSSDVQIQYRKNTQNMLMPEELRLVKGGRLINAIKLVRQRTGWTLRDAKELIDRYRD